MNWLFKTTLTMSQGREEHGTVKLGLSLMEPRKEGGRHSQHPDLPAAVQERNFVATADPFTPSRIPRSQAKQQQRQHQQTWQSWWSDDQWQSWSSRSQDQWRTWHDSSSYFQCKERSHVLMLPLKSGAATLLRQSDTLHGIVQAIYSRSNRVFGFVNQHWVHLLMQGLCQVANSCKPGLIRWCPTHRM